LGVKVADKKVGFLFLVNDFEQGAVMHSRDFMRQKGLALPGIHYSHEERREYLHET
jgi:hypothetical protein